MCNPAIKGDDQLPELMLTYVQLEHPELISIVFRNWNILVKEMYVYIYIYIHIYIAYLRLQIVGHFV